MATRKHTGSLHPQRRAGEESEMRTFDAPLEPALSLYLVPHKSLEEEAEPGSGASESNMPIQLPESGLLSRLIDRIKTL